MLHPDWNFDSPSFDADLAIISLGEEIAFTDYIQPVCLPNGLQNVVGIRGTVAGFGVDRDNTLVNTNRPKHVNLVIKDDRMCIYDHPILAKVGSLR